MAGSLRKVSPGDPLRMPAETFNTFIDVARDFQQRQRGVHRDAQRDRLDTGLVLVRNTSGAARGRFDVLGIDGPAIHPDDNLLEFQSRVILKGVLPAEAHAGRFVVLLEPLADGAIGRACVDGACVVQVEVDSAEARLADVVAGQTGKLAARASGSVRILWFKAPSTYPATAWAVVQLGCGGGGSPLRWAKITSIASNVVNAKLADAEGNVDPQAAEFRVYMYATDTTGVTWTPTLADASPKLVVGQYIQIVQMPACGAARLAGWWMVPPSLDLTCAPAGDDADLDWLLANVAALRALVEGA